MVKRTRVESHDQTGPDRRACPFIIPIPAVAQRLATPAALAPDQCHSLLNDLATIADPRHRRGRRHPLVAVLRRDGLRGAGRRQVPGHDRRVGR